ncbi:hypothetical protein [uncultured Jatrophihabitans sp.]|uniref:hypothetical protein n=1 Tax=uncultured Jatrophihabitans sp. TaxID=1610747 RepID=UPI0035CBD6D8
MPDTFTTTPVTISATLEHDAELALENQYTSFAKREPAILTGLLSSPILGLVTLLAPGDPSKLSAQITAGAVSLIVVLQGFLVRRYVRPTWKRTTGRDFPDPATYSDAFDDGTGVQAPATPPPSARTLDDRADETTGEMLGQHALLSGRHEAPSLEPGPSEATDPDLIRSLLPTS